MSEATGGPKLVRDVQRFREVWEAWAELRGAICDVLEAAEEIDDYDCLVPNLGAPTVEPTPCGECVTCRMRTARARLHDQLEAQS